MKYLFAFLVFLSSAFHAIGQNKEELLYENIALYWPAAEGWEQESVRKSGNKTITELIHNGETLDNWTLLGTMITYPAHTGSVDEAMNMIFEQARKKYSGAKLTLIEKNDQSKHPWIIFTIENVSSKPRSEVWHILLGKEHMYANQIAVKEKGLREDFVSKWASVFRNAKIVMR